MYLETSDRSTPAAGAGAPGQRSPPSLSSKERAMANSEPMHVYPVPDGGASTPLPSPEFADLMDIPANADTDEDAAPSADYDQQST